MAGEIVVCKVYRLATTNKKFVLEHKTLIRSRSVVTRDYFEKMAKNWKDNGLYYEEDKEATAKYYADSETQNANRKAAKELSEKAALTLANAIKGVATGAIEAELKPKKEAASQPAEEKQPNEDKPEKVVIPEGEPNGTWEREQILAWLDDLEDTPDYKKSLGAERLLNEVVTPYLESKQNNNENQ